MPAPTASRNLPANHQILNFVRQSASDEYRSRIPTAVQSNVAEIAEILWNPINSRFRNEFISNLVNRIGEVIIRSRQWSDPFKVFKKKDIPYGANIEEISVGLIYGHTRNPSDMAELLRKHEPYVARAFHYPTRSQSYPFTLDMPRLRRAFMEEYGLSRFTAAEIDAQINSDELDEYNTVLARLEAHDMNHGIFKIHIPDLTEDIEDADLLEARAKIALKKLQATAGRMRKLSSDYLALDAPRQIKTFAEKQNCVLLCTPEFLASANVMTLAAAFNIDRADIPYRIIEVYDFFDPDIKAIVMDEDALIIHDLLYQTDTFYNGATVTTNYYLHHDQIIGFSPLLPMAAFTTGEGTEVPSVEVKDVSTPFKLGYISPENGSIIEGLPEDIKPGSSFQLIGWEKLTYSGTDWSGNPVEYVEINASSVDIVRKLDTGAAANATIGASPYVDVWGVLHVPYDFMLQLDGSNPPSSMSFDVAATSGVFGPDVQTPTSVKIRGKVLSGANAVFYETNELTRTAYNAYCKGHRDPEEATSTADSGDSGN